MSERDRFGRSRVKVAATLPTTINRCTGNDNKFNIHTEPRMGEREKMQRVKRRDERDEKGRRPTSVGEAQRRNDHWKKRTQQWAGGGGCLGVIRTGMA